ncbi:hypothetical protein NPIL_280671 [Nephila pilipes]|uniref:Uncharacterized protein n=1 Tax=Nephila pilipes TaxID=299642 RepID=A0A8X6TS62_NEPPI|nr:hypothetical protein NPIL_280671 [Nephila pilipes]
MVEFMDCLLEASFAEPTPEFIPEETKKTLLLLDHILHRCALNHQTEEANSIKNNFKNEMEQVNALKISLAFEIEQLKNQIRAEIFNTTKSNQPESSDDGFTTKTRRNCIKSKDIT